MNYIYLGAVVAFYAYLFFIWWLIKEKKFKQFVLENPTAKMLPSISDSYYEFEKINNSRMFVVFTWTVGGLIVFGQYVYEFKELTDWILIASGTFMMAIGIAAPFRQKEVNVYHYTFSIIAMSGAMAATITEGWPVYDHFTFKVLLLMLWALFPLAAYLFSIHRQ